MTDSPTTFALIMESGIKVPGKCSYCKGEDLWAIEGGDGKPPAKVCSWCDVSVEKRFTGRMDAAA